MKGFFFFIQLYIFHFIRPRIKEIMNLILIFHFYFLNINISVTIYNIDLECSVCALDNLVEGST